MPLSPAKRLLTLNDIEIFYSFISERSFAHENPYRGQLNKTRSGYHNYLNNFILLSEQNRNWSLANKNILLKQIDELIKINFFAAMHDPDIAKLIKINIEHDGENISSLLIGETGGEFMDRLSQIHNNNYASSIQQNIPKFDDLKTGALLSELLYRGKEIESKNDESSMFLQLDLANIFNSKGCNFLEKRAMCEAIECFRNAITTINKITSDATERDLALYQLNLASGLFNLGITHTDNKNYEASANCNQEAISIINSIPDQDKTKETEKRLNNCKINLANAAYFLGYDCFNKNNFKAAVDKFQEAIDNLNQVSPEFQLGSMEERLASCYRNLACAYSNLGSEALDKKDFKTAEDRFEEAIVSLNKVSLKYKTEEQQAELKIYYGNLEYTLKHRPRYYNENPKIYTESDALNHVNKYINELEVKKEKGWIQFSIFGYTVEQRVVAAKMLKQKILNKNSSIDIKNEGPLKEDITLNEIYQQYKYTQKKK